MEDSTILPDQARSWELFDRYGRVFGGDMNFHNRETKHDDRQALLHSIYIDDLLSDSFTKQDAHREVEGFVDNHLYTSAKAFRKRFRKQGDTSVAKFELQDGLSWQAPERDMPLPLQRLLLDIALQDIEKSCYAVLTEVKKSALERSSIFELEGFEMTTKNLRHFFVNKEGILRPEFKAHLTERNPGDFEARVYETILEEACEIRNKYIHRTPRSVNFIRDAFRTAINVVEIFTRGPPPDKEYLSVLRRLVVGWAPWSDNEKAQSIEKMLKIFAEIDDEVARGLRSPAAALASKKRLAKKIIIKRPKYRLAMAQKIGAFVWQHAWHKGVFNFLPGIGPAVGIESGFCHTAEDFVFPTVGIPLLLVLTDDTNTKRKHDGTATEGIKERPSKRRRVERPNRKSLLVRSRSSRSIPWWRQSAKLRDSYWSLGFSGVNLL